MTPPSSMHWTARQRACRLTRRRTGHADPERQGEGVSSVARAAGRVYHSEPVGCRHGATARVVRLRGTGHDEPRPGEHAGPRRRRGGGQPRGGAGELPRDRRGDESARERRSGERLRRPSQGGGGDDAPGRGDRTGRRLPRGRQRESGQAYENAGADVLYAPGLRDLDTIRTVVSSVRKPVNVVMSHGDPSLTLAQLAAAGVKRVSIGGSLSRLALAAVLEGVREMKDVGGFTWMRRTVRSAELRQAFSAGSA